MTQSELATLTPEEKRVKCAELCCVADNWHILKDGWYYRPGSCGYTNDIREAGIYTLEEAMRHLLSCRELTMVHALLPDYANDLNAMHEAEKTLWGYLSEQYFYDLLEVCNPYADRLAKDWTPDEYKRGASATAAQRLDAFLMTKL